MAKEKKSIFVEFLGDSPLVRVVDYLIEVRPFETTKEEIIKNTRISRNTFFKVWKEIEKFDLVMKTRKVGNAEMFVLNDENELVRMILRLEYELGAWAMEKEGKIKVKA